VYGRRMIARGENVKSFNRVEFPGRTVMLAVHGRERAIAGTSAPNVAGTWEGTWSHRAGSGQITLRLAQEGTTDTGRQSVVGVVPVFDRYRRQIRLAEQIREGSIENSTLIFNVEVRDGREHQINFTLSVSDDSMVGTVCAFTCGTVRLKRSNR
jgi:hypothetical protein